MDLLKKQGFFNSLILYAGTALGFVNLIILFQRHLTIEEIGFFNLMIVISLLYAQIASFGISNIIYKYLPHYRSEDKRHGGFVTFVVIWSLIGFAIVTILFLLFKKSVIYWYRDKDGAPLLNRYYYYLIPLSFLTMIFTVLESLAITVFKNVLSSFLREVFLRLFTLVSVLFIAYKIIDYHGFLMIYLAASIIAAFMLLVYISRGDDFKFARVAPELMGQRNPLISYGFFTVLSASSFVMIQNLDTLMLSVLTKESLSFVGVYTTFFAIALVISLPAKALGRTSLQIIAQSWATNDLNKIDKIYYKTSVVQMLIGCLLFIGLVINKPFIMVLLHKKEYANYFDVFIIVGTAFLVDMTGGLNGYIMNISKYYRLTTVFIVSGVVLCVISNLILIPRIGMMGAALSYLITMFVLNFAYWLFNNLKFGLQPFGKTHLYIIAIFTLCLLIGFYLPALKNVYIDMVYRSAIIGVIYIYLAYHFNISEDINNAIDKILNSKHKPA